MPKQFIDPWGVIIPGGDIEAATLMGRMATHTNGETGPIIDVDEIWPNVYLLSIGNKHCYLTDRIEQFSIEE